MRTPFLQIIFAVCLLLSTRQTHASITIDSVATVNSTCSNNGSATVYATCVPAGGLFYAIVAGPVTSPIQNSNIFSSLYSGLYTARVYDINFDSVETQFNVGGNYQLPSFNVTTINPTCAGFTDGSITAVADTNYGLAPYTYQMISPIVGPLSPQNFFPGLNDNTYQIRMTDGCGNYQTRSATLISSGTGLVEIPSSLYPLFNKIGCDTMMVTVYFNLFKEKGNMPVTLSFNTASGTQSKQLYPVVVDTINSVPAIYMLTDTVPGITYSDYCEVVVTDVCGAQAVSYYNDIAPFEWVLGFQATTINCVATFTAALSLKQIPYFPYHNINAMNPVSFTLYDMATNMLVDSMTCNCNPWLHEEVPGNMYSLTVTDGCGDVFQQNIVWPTAGAPVVNVNYFWGCRDSTAMLQFECLGFQSAPALFFVSGPTVVQSSKSGFAYSDTITYPRTFTGGIPGYIIVKDCPPGLYVFEVTDSCGNLVQGSFTIDAFMVSSFKYSWHVKPSCLNNNTLYYNFNEGSYLAVYASITGIGNTYFEDFYPSQSFDSITNLSVGTYAVEIYYMEHNGSGTYYDGSIINSEPDCWVVYDTITIAPYTNSTFLTNNTVYCNGINYVELIPDSSRGVPPYQFAIISGPQTFPLQDSAVFQIQQFGNYLISMEDVCGNNYTQQITVSSDSFPPIAKVGFFCDGSYAALSSVSSSYFSYVWQSPNGTITIGDSLVFNPFAAADTGWYHVLKIVNINGCNDTLEIDYYIPSVDSITQNLSVCEGDSVVVGIQVYYLPGVYHDTLITVNGCDSLVVTTLSFSALPVDSNTVSICNGDSIQVGINYYTLPGMYVDTIPDVGFCKKIMITQLNVITIVDSVSVSICPGDSLVIGNIVHQQAGIFNDTLVGATGCDSIIIASINLKPIPAFIITSSADTVDAGSAFELTCDNEQAIQYYWHGQAYFSTTDSFATAAIVDTTEWIYLSVTDSSGCASTDSILIFTREIVCDTCDSNPGMVIPNVFTPNGDGVNDVFEIPGITGYKKRILSVFNRWGNEIYRSDAYYNNWNGSDQAAGNYYYVLQLFDGIKSSTKKGTVQIIK